MDRVIGLGKPLRRAIILAAAIAPLCVAGLASAQQNRRQPPPAAARQSGAVRTHYVTPTTSRPVAFEVADGRVVNLDQVAHDLETARSLEKDGNPHCVDLYYWSAMRAWRSLAAVEPASPGAGNDESSPAAPPSRGQQLYNAALKRLIQAGQRFKRLDPHSHLAIDDAGTRILVPILRHGLVWEPEDYCQLLCSEDVHSRRINHYFVSPGVGAPLVAVRVQPSEESSALRRLPFAVTAVLRPTLPEDGLSFPATLDLFNPHLTDSLEIAGRRMPLAYDLTAPLALVQNTAPAQYFDGFVRPDDVNVQPELVMLEPYQPGKIPVIFIHGLFSDPLAWANAANELMATKDLYRQCQFWAYSYPTGGDLLESAAALREDLLAAPEHFDPGHEDPALENMVIITHSLGGLMGKLQITSSQDQIWAQMANAPLDAVRASPAEKARLARMVYFEPVPWITRAVFMGTPFKGSTWALRTVGRVSSDLVRFGAQDNVDYKAFMRENRDIFAPYLRRSRPTTVDMLEPKSPILAALAEMPVSPQTQLHTVIGDGSRRLLREPSDGIVTVTSARHPGVESEIIIPASHTELHSHPQAIAELVRILREHIATASTAPAGPYALQARAQRPTGKASGAPVGKFSDVFGD